MTITINNATSTVDPLNEYTQQYRESTFEQLELQQLKAFKDAYPHAVIEFQRDCTSNLLMVDADDMSGAIEESQKMQTILEDIYDLGLFWQ